MDKNESANTLSNDLSLTSKLAFRWKMLFNANTTVVNQPNNYYFQEKRKVQIHSTISHNNIHVERASYQNHHGILLDENINFKHHVDSAIQKVDKDISKIKKT